MGFITHITFLFLTYLLQSFHHFALANTALSWPDLNSDSLTDFTTQASNWVVSTGATPSSAISTACTLFPALGGPSVFTSSTGSFERTYYLLESHVSVFITAEVTFIDDWASGDILTVTVGTSSPLDFTFGSASSGFFTSNQCGTSQNDFPSVVTEIMTANSDTNLTLQFSKTTTSSTSQFSIRNINIALSNQTVSTVSPSGSAQLCFFTTNTGFSSNACACPLDQYESSTSPVTCSDCHFTCETCYGASSANCLTCKSGLSFTGSACVVCDTSCATCFGTGSTQCSSCYTGYYLYSDSVCRGYCATGYSRTTGGINYCDDPLTTCTINCTNTTNTTNSTTTDQTTLCSDLNTANYDQVSSGILYYYPDDSTCKTNCLTPYTADGDGQVRYCNLSLSEEDQNTISALDSAANTASAVMTAGVAVMAATNPADPNGISVGSLSKMFEYTRYINVTRSAKLEAFYKNKRSSPGTVSIGPAMSQESIARFTSRELPNIFDKQNVNSNFLVEFFRNLETLLIISAAIIILLAIKSTVRKKLRALIQTHNQITVAVLAFLIMQFYNVYTDILFMSTIEFMSFKGGNGLDWLSFFFAVFFLALGVAILVFHFRILWNYQKLKSRSKAEYIHEVMSEFQKKHEKTEVLYRDFKDITFVQQGYLFLLTFRAAVTGIVMSAFYNFPGVQVGYNIAMNALAICYLLISFPFKNTPSVYQQMAYEVNLLFVNICLCFMVVLDATESQADNLRAQLGDAIIIAIFVSKFVVIITIAPKIIEALPSVLKIYRDSINRLRRVRNLSSKPIGVESSRSPTIQDEDRPIMLEAITFEGSQRKQTEDHLKTEIAKITFEKDEVLSPATRSDTIKQSVLSRTCVAEEDDEVGAEGMRPVMKFQIRDTIMK